MKKKVEPTVYYYRGQIERGNGRCGYVWKDGYSANSENGLTLYPWMTRGECRRAARCDGSRALFNDDTDK